MPQPRPDSLVTSRTARLRALAAFQRSIGGAPSKLCSATLVFSGPSHFSVSQHVRHGPRPVREGSAECRPWWGRTSVRRSIPPPQSCGTVRTGGNGVTGAVWAAMNADLGVIEIPIATFPRLGWAWVWVWVSSSSASSSPAGAMGSPTPASRRRPPGCSRLRRYSTAVAQSSSSPSSARWPLALGLILLTVVVFRAGGL